MKAVKLKLGTHMDSGLVYRVYQNQGQGPITLWANPLIGFRISLLMKYFCHTFLKNCKGYKVETWYTHGHVLCIPESEQKAHNSWR